MRDHMDHCNHWMKVWGRFSYQKTAHVDLSYWTGHLPKIYQFLRLPGLESCKHSKEALASKLPTGDPGLRKWKSIHSDSLDVKWMEYSLRKGLKWQSLESCCVLLRCWDLANPTLPKSVVSKTLVALVSLYSTIDICAGRLIPKWYHLTSFSSSGKMYLNVHANIILGGSSHLVST